MPTAKRPNYCQEIMERPCQRREAFCHLCHATSPALYPAYSSSLINTLCEDEVMTECTGLYRDVFLIL